MAKSQSFLTLAPEATTSSNPLPISKTYMDYLTKSVHVSNGEASALCEHCNASVMVLAETDVPDYIAMRDLAEAYMMHIYQAHRPEWHAFIKAHRINNGWTAKMQEVFAPLDAVESQPVAMPMPVEEPVVEQGHVSMTELEEAKSLKAILAQIDKLAGMVNQAQSIVKVAEGRHAQWVQDQAFMDEQGVELVRYVKGIDLKLSDMAMHHKEMSTWGDVLYPPEEEQAILTAIQALKESRTKLVAMTLYGRGLLKISEVEAREKALAQANDLAVKESMDALRAQLNTLIRERQLEQEGKYSKLMSGVGRVVVRTWHGKERVDELATWYDACYRETSKRVSQYISSIRKANDGVSPDKQERINNRDIAEIRVDAILDRLARYGFINNEGVAVTGKAKVLKNGQLVDSNVTLTGMVTLPMADWVQEMVKICLKIRFWELQIGKKSNGQFPTVEEICQNASARHDLKINLQPGEETIEPNWGAINEADTAMSAAFKEAAYSRAYTLDFKPKGQPDMVSNKRDGGYTANPAMKDDDEPVYREDKSRSDKKKKGKKGRGSQRHNQAAEDLFA